MIIWGAAVWFAWILGFMLSYAYFPYRESRERMAAMEALALFVFLNVLFFSVIGVIYSGRAVFDWAVNG